MIDQKKPRYVERDGETVYRPPYLQADTFLTSWVLPSKMEALQSVLDEALNRPSGGAVDYRPLAPAVMLVLADIQKVSSLDPRDSQRGWIPETDICFWILAGGYVNGKLDHVVWYIPYIWVTNAYTMATGREVFGYPKSIGWAQLPRGPRDPGPIWADALVIPEFTAETEVTRQRVITLAREGGAAGASLPTWGAGEGVAAARGILDMIRSVSAGGIDWHLVVSLFEDLFGRHLPIVFLKQFRDAVDPTAACYQAIIEANATVTAFRGAGGLPCGWALSINDYASHQITQKLALSRQQNVDVGFWVKFSFSMDMGTEVWRAK